MNREEFLKEHTSICDQIKEVTVRKNADYTGASSDDPFFNFKTVETLHISTTEQGFLTRMTDKLTRIISLTKPGAVNKVLDEAVEDTLIDFANYCILMVCYLRSKKLK